MISRTLNNRILFILALAGVGITLHLTLADLNYVDIGCGGSEGCIQVAQTTTAHGFGIPALAKIPTAAFGIGLYVILVAISFLRAMGQPETNDKRLRLLFWVLTLSGVGVSAWLTWLEAFVIHAWCKWCVASAIVMLVLFILSSMDLLHRTKSAIMETNP
jgi:uncharacterized membrane protein